MRTYTPEEVLVILRYIRAFSMVKLTSEEQAQKVFKKLTFEINNQIREVERDE